MSLSQGSEDMLSRPERYIRDALKVCHYVGVGFIIAMMILTVVQSIGRYGFNHPIPGDIELSSFFLVTSTFLVCAYTMVEKRHVSVGLIADRFSPRAQAIIDSFTYILCLVVAIVAFWQSFVRGINMVQVRQSSGVLHIPIFPFIFIVGIGWGMFALATAIHLVHLLAKAVKR